MHITFDENMKLRMREKTLRLRSQCLDQRPGENGSDAFDRALFAAASVTTDE
jgi:hypothetical protein